MRLTIHRGAKEIGGSCVEVCSKSTRVIIDLGMPLTNERRIGSERALFTSDGIPGLVKTGLLPTINGLYSHESKDIDAVLLSHAHQDHYGLLYFINPEIPVFLSRGTKTLVDASEVFLPSKVKLKNTVEFEMWHPFTIGDLTFTPYLMDHSGFDASAFLIEGHGKRVFYSGDFRGHGRKQILFHNLKHHPVKEIDYLLLEGSMLGRGIGAFSDEESIEQGMVAAFRKKKRAAFVFCSSQNIDRLVSIFRAAKRTKQTLVIDLYTAYILDRLQAISKHIPHFTWPNIKVFYFFNHKKLLLENGHSDFVEKCQKHRIYKEEFIRNQANMVMIAKSNSAFRNLLRQMGDLNEVLGVYSMWEGYLEKNDFREPLKTQGMAFETIHTSGHAPESALQELVTAFEPKCVIPIHTFQPQRFPSLFPVVRLVADGEEIML